MKKLLFSTLLTFATLISTAQITTPFGLFTGCKPTSIQLDAPLGYASYLWSTGETTQTIHYVLVGSGGGQILDTSTVGLTCFDLNGIPFPQTPVVVRSIREPKLLDRYNKIYNYTLTDSIKCELVLSYIYAPEYVFTFTQTDSKVNGLEVVSTYVSSNRWCYLNQVNPPLTPGKYYHITVHARINGNDYCTGNYAEIGIAKDSTIVSSLEYIDYSPLDVEIWPNPSKTDFQIAIDSDIKKPANISIYDVQGKLVYTQYVETLPYYSNINQYINSGVYEVVISQDGNIKTTTIEKL